MDKKEIRSAIEKIIPQVLEGAAASRMANKNAVISGKRIELKLEGRTLEAAYYSSKEKMAPLIIAYHGGGFLFGGSALDDELWSEASSVLKADIVSVDYRMSPEVKDYDCLYDAYDSAVYLINNYKDYGFDPDNVSLLGCSAGGNLAAAVCMLSKQKNGPCFKNQILLYPFLDGKTDPDEKGRGSFEGLFPHVMNELHFSPEKADDPLLSPVFADTSMLKDLPNAIVVFCEHDNLRNEAEKYGNMLKNAGVPVHMHLAEGMPHGFLESGYKKALSPVELELLGKDAEALISSGKLRKAADETLEFVKEHIV